MLPGGFTLFMFIPKECEPPRDSYKENLEVLRELWSQDIGEETLARLAKMDLFLPKNVHHMEIQIETALKMLEEMTVEEGCCTVSLEKALAFVERYSAHLSRLIEGDPMLATKIVYQLDVELQKQFNLIAEHDGPMKDMYREDTTYARDQLHHWLYPLEVNRAPVIMLPAELGGRGAQRSERSRIEERDSESEDDAPTPKKKAKKKISNSERFVINERTVNEHMYPKWCMPAGKDYRAVFKGDSLKGWPIVQQPGYGKRSLCCKFQSTGQCKFRCGYAHIYHNEMTATDITATTEKFKAIYAMA